MEDVYMILVLVSFICLAIGLVRPSIFSRVMKSWATRGKIGLVFGLATIIFFILFGIASDKNEVAKQAETIRLAAQITESKANQETSATTETVAESVLEGNREATPAVEEKRVDETFEVVSVVDGDTVKVNISGKTETLRLIGIDTPETVDPRKTVQCFGKEASDKAKVTLTGKKVKLEADPSQGERDKYQRLLRYVFFEDGSSFNKMMIEDGFAHEYTYNTPYKYQTEYKEAETSARENKRGLWGDLCNGDTEQSASSANQSTTPAVIVAPVPVEKSSGSSSSYSCNCKKTCPNMSCSEAQYQLNTCGCSARDADGDGIACDSQCQ